MASKAEQVAAEGAAAITTELVAAGLTPAAQLGALYFLADRTTALGQAGVRVRGRVQSTRMSGRAGVVVATAFIHSPETNCILSGAGWPDLLPETVSVGLRGVAKRQLGLHDHREIATSEGAAKAAATIRSIVEADLEWWCGHFADLDATYAYLAADEPLGAAKNSLVGIALALYEGDAPTAEKFTLRRFFEVPAGMDRDGYDFTAELVGAMAEQFQLTLPIPTWSDVQARR